MGTAIEVDPFQSLNLPTPSPWIQHLSWDQEMDPEGEAVFGVQVSHSNLRRRKLLCLMCWPGFRESGHGLQATQCTGSKSNRSLQTNTELIEVSLGDNVK